MAKRKTYNPYRVKTEKLTRFRGVSDSDNEQMLNKAYVKSSDNLDSFRIREMIPRVGQDSDNYFEDLTENTGGPSWLGGIFGGKRLNRSIVMLKGSGVASDLIATNLGKTSAPDFIPPIIGLLDDGYVRGVITDSISGLPIDVCVVTLTVDGVPQVITTEATDSGIFNFGRFIGDLHLHLKITSDDYYTYSEDIERSTGVKSYELVAEPVTAFVSEWTTTGALESVTIPTHVSNNYVGSIDWGDGTVVSFTTYNDAAFTHLYATTGTYTVTISGVFERFTGEGNEQITAITNLGFVGWTNFAKAFRSCDNLTSFVCGTCDTSDVTDMSQMFDRCRFLTLADVSEFDTSAVTSMYKMFNLCYVLSAIDVSGFDTSSVTRMDYMFHACYLLTAIDVSSFDTSQVTTMESMFDLCSLLTSLDLSSFDTSKVESMDYMFILCESIPDIDCSAFNTSAVTQMRSMFRSCTALETLDLSSFDVSVVETMKDMLTGVTLTTTSYSNILIHFAATPTLVSGILFSGGFSKYNAGGLTARNILTGVTNSWNITDGGAA